MKTSELRIGNWWTNGDKNYVVDINTLWDIASAEENGNSDLWKPIPLTKEWLLSFDFKYKEETSYPMSKYYKLKSVMISVDLVRLWIPKTRLDGEYVILDCPKYVHKFQNLYFALTGEELTYTPG